MHYHVHINYPSCPRHINISAEKKRDDRADSVTLSRFIIDVEKYRGNQCPSQLLHLMNSIQIACKTVALTLRKSGFSQFQSLGIGKQMNIFDIKKLERHFNEVFISIIMNTFTVCLIACKDSDELIRVEAERAGKYMVVFSATDASVNIDTSLCMGSTFLIFKKRGTSRVEDKDILQSGHKIIAAGYTTYGFATEMVVAFEGGIVNGFTLDNSIGEFIMSEESIRIPRSGKSYCANEGFTHSWDQNLADYLSKLKTEKAASLACSARFTGSFVSDAHRTLKLGGVFINPPIKDLPKGKHKLMFECNPIAFVFTQAGGIATNGTTLIMDIVPEKLHEKSPIYCGSPDDLNFTPKYPGSVRLNLLCQEKDRDDRKEYITLGKFVNDIDRSKSVSSYQFPQLMNAIQTACKSISIALRKCGIAQMYTLDIDKNIKVLDVKKMEKYFNELFVSLVTNSQTACLISCKDNDDIIRIDAERAGKYIVIFSASDASVNIDSSFCIGTTFSVYRKRGSSKVEEKDVLQPGYKMIAGGYALYGISTVLVLAFEGGEFMLTDENVKVPKSGNSYSTNEGNNQSWDMNIVEYLDKKKSLKGMTPWSTRYTGSLVADFHRTLRHGGLYFYPVSKEYPNGKHRLIYECNPLAFIITLAGGIASNGRVRIIDLIPEKINEKTPFYCGSHDDVDELLKAICP